MQPKSNNPPAFPNPLIKYENGVVGAAFEVHPDWAGMNLRDWFAGQALATFDIAADYSRGCDNHTLASRAYNIAEAMLKHRENFV